METAAMTSRPSSTLSLPGSKPEETKVATTASSSKQETKTKAAAKKEPAAKKDAKSDKTADKAPSKGGKKSPTITLVAAKCPSKAGTGRAKRWAKLKTGMTVVAAQELSIPLSYLRRMEAAGHLKIG